MDSSSSFIRKFSWISVGRVGGVGGGWGEVEGEGENKVPERSRGEILAHKL